MLLPLLGGCEDQHLGPLDPDGSPPFIRAFLIAPDSVSLNTLTPSNGQYGITLLCLAQVSDPDGPSTLGPVIADVVPPGGGDPLLSVALATDSTGGNVRFFSGQIRFSVTKTEIGAYRVVLRATDQQRLSGNTVDRRLMVWRTNAPPVISNLVAPDTVVLPPGDTVHIPMSITVSDSNGVADVREVFFRSLDSSDPTKKYLLQDNGDLKNYGDQTAGDGIYSIIVQLTDSPTVRKTYRFAFQALDSFADTSATLFHSITVR
jgi:hypothetical protein